MNLAVTRSRAVIAHHSKSFALASRLLPAEGRDDASIVYAWCRRADDAVDLVPPAEQPRAVGWLYDELSRIYAGEAQPDPVLGGFQAIVRARRIPRAYPAELLAGMEMDAGETIYGSYATLLSYCFRVAGTVGLMMSHVMGVRHPTALRHAAHLGMAMQLTNICRDVAEDWQRGRLYLPDDLLVAAGASHLRARLGEPTLPDEARAPVARVTRELLRRADEFYQSGSLGLAYLSWRSAVAVGTARLVYADIGRVILAQGADPCAARAVVGKPRKWMLALRALVSTRAPRAFTPARLDGELGFCDVVPV
jgi:phytoene synthase